MDNSQNRHSSVEGLEGGGKKDKKKKMYIYIYCSHLHSARLHTDIALLPLLDVICYSEIVENEPRLWITQPAAD